ncbi:TPA: site-specific integrase [Aeromonas dhakensis]|nr:site-specific integrase [Aeromonas dhakensis]
MKITRKQRIVLIDYFPHTDAYLSTYPINNNSIPVANRSYFITDINNSTDVDDSVYLFPLLLEADGTPWHVANMFLLKLATTINEYVGFKDTKDIRKKATFLLDYKIFCESTKDNKNELAPTDLFDFKHPLKSRRPTWRYYSHLVNVEKTKPELLNAKTGTIYQFYRFAATLPNVDLDLQRVETLTNFSFFKQTSSGSLYLLEGEKRSQTVRVAEAVPVNIGYVRDEGEDLRPLFQKELDALLKALQTDEFATDEKLIFYLALCTGERKQTILTMRMRHLAFFEEQYLSQKKKSYKLFANRQNGCDTKYDKPHILHVPIWLAEKIKIWANSKKANQRREKFKKRFGNFFNDDDMYLFLSPAGDCRYMSHSDPRYRKTLSPALGQVTRNLKAKLLKITEHKISPDFTFHWLRATFAMLLYKRCQKLIADKKMVAGTELNHIRYRLHHTHQSTTEHYLRLFSQTNELIGAQEAFENVLFGDVLQNQDVSDNV